MSLFIFILVIHHCWLNDVSVHNTKSTPPLPSQAEHQARQTGEDDTEDFVHCYFFHTQYYANEVSSSGKRTRNSWDSGSTPTTSQGTLVEKSCSHCCHSGEERINHTSERQIPEANVAPRLYIEQSKKQAKRGLHKQHFIWTHIGELNLFEEYGICRSF